MSGGRLSLTGPRGAGYLGNIVMLVLRREGVSYVLGLDATKLANIPGLASM